MFDVIINHLLTTAVGLLIIGASYLVDLIIGSVKVLFTENMKWSWKKAGEDFLKALILAVGIEIWVAIWDTLGWYAGELGADIISITDGVSTGGMFAAIIGGSIWYLKNAFQNAVEFINAKHIKVEVTNPDTEKIAEVAKHAIDEIAAIFTQHDDATVKAGEEQIPELGASCYYKVDVSTPDAFYRSVNGKGFNEGWGYQCVAGFKEFQYSLAGRIVAAGGAASNYGVQPAINNVCALGFTWHQGSAGLQNGDWGIWGNGSYGHVAMYYNGQWFGQNQDAANPNTGNAFNLLGISLNGFTGYYRPNIYAKKNDNPAPTPTPAPTPAPTPTPTINTGDSVIVNGKGYSTSLGTGTRTKNFTNQKMKVILIANGRYACNQYNKGTVGSAAAVTGWFDKSQITKA